MYLGKSRFSRRRWVWLVGAFVLGSGSLPAWAGTFSWTGGDGTSQLWSTGSNWSGGLPPTSASDTIIQFNVTNNPGTSSNPLNQDIANPFVLNQMIFGSGASVSYYLGGNPLQFVVDGGVNPIFRNQGSQDKHIYNAIQVPSGTTLRLINDTWNMRLYGVISGDGTLQMEAQPGGGEWHLYGANTYTGGTVYNGTANSNQGYCRLAVYASGGLGTGLVTLNGATFLLPLRINLGLGCTSCTPIPVFPTISSSRPIRPSLPAPRGSAYRAMWIPTARPFISGGQVRPR